MIAWKIASLHFLQAGHIELEVSMDEKMKNMLAKLQRNVPDYYSIDTNYEQHRTGEPLTEIQLYSSRSGYYKKFDSFEALETYVNSLPERNEILYRDFQ